MLVCPHSNKALPLSKAHPLSVLGFFVPASRRAALQIVASSHVTCWKTNWRDHLSCQFRPVREGPGSLIDMGDDGQLSDKQIAAFEYLSLDCCIY